jgi:hypothetical protein
MANPTICSSLKPQNIGEEHLPISEENNQQTIQSKSKRYQEGDLQGIQEISKVFLGSSTWSKQTITDADAIEHDGSGRAILSEANIHEIDAIQEKEIRHAILGISESLLGHLWS